MALTQETILTFLLKRDGKAKNSELLSKFKGLLNCSDLAEKKQNRELFKTFVNNVAVVKEMEGEKHVVLRKRYAHLLKEIPTVADQKLEFGEGSDTLPGSLCEQSGHYEDFGKESSDLASSNVSLLSDPNCDHYNCNKDSSPVELALQRSMGAAKLDAKTIQTSPIRSSKVLQFNIISKDNETNLSVSQARCINSIYNTGGAVPQKPYMLPLRMPPPPPRPINPEVPELNTKVKASGTLNEDQDLEKSFRTKRRLFEEVLTPRSPHLRRASKNAKPVDEPKYSATVPLDSTEHEWLVKSAIGCWSQVHGLLLQDAELAQKKDFMSGFTALHWAAKSGNSEMVRTIIELCQRGHADYDVNIKSHGGYTALHIAAMHDREQVMALLVRDYGANKNVRDNNGKKPYHYLQEHASAEVRELLGEPQVLNQEPANERNGDDHFTEMPKGFSTIGRLFQPYGVGLKKKHKQRPGFRSVSEDLEDEKDESTLGSRSFSDIFKQGGFAPH